MAGSKVFDASPGGQGEGFTSGRETMPPGGPVQIGGSGVGCPGFSGGGSGRSRRWIVGGETAGSADKHDDESTLTARGIGTTTAVGCTGYVCVGMHARSTSSSMHVIGQR